MIHKQELLQYKSLTKSFYLSNDYKLESPAPTSNSFLESFLLVSHQIQEYQSQSQVSLATSRPVGDFGIVQMIPKHQTTTIG